MREKQYCRTTCSSILKRNMKLCNFGSLNTLIMHELVEQWEYSIFGTWPILLKIFTDILCWIKLPSVTYKKNTYIIQDQYDIKSYIKNAKKSIPKSFLTSRHRDTPQKWCNLDKEYEFWILWRFPIRNPPIRDKYDQKMRSYFITQCWCRTS